MSQPLGQHFLKTPGPARALVRSLDLQDADTVVEVGPGHGELTRFLAEAPHESLLCIEKDVVLAASVVRRFEDDGSISVVHGDVRDLLPGVAAQIGDKPWKLAGNIPYYLTSFLVRIVSDLPNPPVRAAFLMQKEVAERISAKPGDFTKLAAFTGTWADTEIVASVPRSAFSPPPKVDSAVLSFIRRDSPVADRTSYDDVARRAFAQPRKVLANNLMTDSFSKDAVYAALESVGLARNARPQDLSVEVIERLAELLRQH